MKYLFIYARKYLYILNMEILETSVREVVHNNG